MSSSLFQGFQNKGRFFFVSSSGALAGGVLGWGLYQYSFTFTVCPGADGVCFSYISWSFFGDALIIGGIFVGFVAACAMAFKSDLSGQKNLVAKNIDENRAKDGLINMVLHHIRTPLTGMMWSIKELATETPTEGAQKTRLDRLYEENIRVLNTVEQLIKTSQANMGHVSYSFVDMNTENLERLMSESISKMRAAAYAKHISVEVETLPLSKRLVKVDKDKIITIIQTLFENAITYTKDGGDVRIRIEEKGDDFLCHVSDSGIGIPEAEKGKIFSQFFRSTNAKQERPNGVGIGLFLAKTFAKSHNGDITFASKARGTTFTVRLPIFIPTVAPTVAATTEGTPQ
jgi:signal transduction histidine kinase